MTHDKGIIETASRLLEKYQEQEGALNLEAVYLGIRFAVKELYGEEVVEGDQKMTEQEKGAASCSSLQAGEACRAQALLPCPDIVITSIGGSSPVQAEGTIGDKPFYFRARYGQWSLSVGGDDVVGAPEWYFGAPYLDLGKTDDDIHFSAGYMPENAARSFIYTAAVLYANTRATPQVTDAQRKAALDALNRFDCTTAEPTVGIRETYFGGDLSMDEMDTIHAALSAPAHQVTDAQRKAADALDEILEMIANYAHEGKIRNISFVIARKKGEVIHAALSAPAVPVIEGLDEAIEFWNKQTDWSFDFSQKHIIMQAARAYAKLQKGV